MRGMKKKNVEKNLENFPIKFFTLLFFLQPIENSWKIENRLKFLNGKKFVLKLTSYRYPPFVRKSSLHRLRLILLSFHRMHSNEMTISYDA